MGIYLRTKFQVSSIIITCFRQGVILHPPTTSKQIPKNPTHIRVNALLSIFLFLIQQSWLIIFRISIFTMIIELLVILRIIGIIPRPKFWVYVIVMSRTPFRVNLHSIVWINSREFNYEVSDCVLESRLCQSNVWGI